MINYEVLRIIWWMIMGILLAGFAIMDGFDLGVAILLPIAGRNDTQRRIAINAVGPVWEGNQVWFILGGGVFFAAWPYLYATSFSGFYLVMFLVLATFIFRPVGFKYRSKITNPIWRSTWDWILAICGFLAAFAFGVAVGNVLQGVPFHFDDSLRVFYTGGFWPLFNGFGIYCGLASVVMLMMHGGFYLAIKSEGAVRQRSMMVGRVCALLLVLFFAGGAFWIADSLQGYVLTHIGGYTLPSNPLRKSVSMQSGAWIANYVSYPYLMIVPILGFLGPLLAMVTIQMGRGRFAFVCSSVGLAGIIGSVGMSMFPFILPSSSNPAESLVVWDASASQLSLEIMLFVAIIFLPIVLLYTAWVYHVMRGKVTEKSISSNDQAY